MDFAFLKNKSFSQRVDYSIKLENKNEIIPDIREKPFYLFNKDTDRSFCFRVIHCVPKETCNKPSFRDFELYDVDWVVSYDQTNITINSLDLLNALSGQHVSLTIFTDEEDQLHNRIIQHKKQLEDREDSYQE